MRGRCWLLCTLLAACASLGGNDGAAAHLGVLSYSDVVVRGAAMDYKLRSATHLIPGFGAEAVGKITRRDVVAHEAEITAWLRRTLKVELAGAALEAKSVILPKHAYFQGKIVPYSQAKVGVLTHALNYGTAAFAGVRAYWNEKEKQLYIFRAIDHYHRLLNSCKLLCIQLD